MPAKETRPWRFPFTEHSLSRSLTQTPSPPRVTQTRGVKNEVNWSLFTVHPTLHINWSLQLHFQRFS